MQYFADTTFFVALFAQRDSHHDRAVETIRRVADEAGPSPPMVFTDYVFDELLTTLRFRTRSHKIAADAGRKVLASPLLKMVTIDPQTFEGAWRLFLKRADKDWSFTDCTSFNVMEELGLHEALSFDPNFKEAGFMMSP